VSVDGDVRTRALSPLAIRPVNARSSSSARAQSRATARRSREFCEQTAAVDYAF
jgi:hypothetical protein